MNPVTLPRMDQDDLPNDSAGFGALKTRHGNLPLAALTYETQLRCLAVSTTITQVFYNPFDECIEAVYVFPLEGEQAVVKCEMLVGERLIRANLRERSEAREQYQQALRRGHRAALLEENRSETFSLSVGNIAPGEAIQVRITTVGQVSVSHGQWTLRLPLVVAPRYVSGIALPGRSVGGGIVADTNAVPDASTVSPPTLLPGFPNPVDLHLSVEIDGSGFGEDFDWKSTLQSSLHSVMARRVMDGQCDVDSRCVVSIQPGERVDRDFILRGRFDDQRLTTRLEVESSDDGDATFAVHLIPPKPETLAPRDVSFVLDRSGSMSGWKIRAATRGIARLIDALRDGDRFQLIAFDDKIDSPKGHQESGWIAVNDRSRWNAVSWLAKIGARGGTEMEAAIKQALLPFQDAVGDSDSAPRSSALVLVTDGQISGEDSVIRALESCPRRSRPRLFCLGVDRTVNASILRRLADYSGGTFELAESENRLDEVLQSFADEIGSPAITDLSVEALSWHTDSVRLAPQSRTDLYHGRSISLFGRGPNDHPLRVRLAGRLSDGSAWSEELTSTPIVTNDESVPLLKPLWGRRRVRELEDRFVGEGNVDEGLRQSIIRCSLESQVLSRFTAYVAVDDSETVAQGRAPHQITQPVEYPEGWQRSIPNLAASMLIPVSLPNRHPSRQTTKQTMKNAVESLPKFKRFLMQQGIDEATWNAAEHLARQSGASIAEILTYQGSVEARTVAQALAHASGVPHVDLRIEHISLETIELVPESVARENTVLPFKVNGPELTILVSDPSDLETIEKLRFILNRPVSVAVETKEAIESALNQYYGQIEGESADSMLQEFTDTAIDFTETDDLVIDEYDDCISALDLDAGDSGIASPRIHAASPISRSEPMTGPMGLSKRLSHLLHSNLKLPTFCASEDSSSDFSQSALNESPVVRLVSLILERAVEMEASAILIRPGKPDWSGVQIEYLLDGKLVQQESARSTMLAAIITRLKILANLNPQPAPSLIEGTIRFVADGRTHEVGVRIAPQVNGESALIVLNEKATQSPEVKAWLDACVSNPCG